MAHCQSPLLALRVGRACCPACRGAASAGGRPSARRACATILMICCLCVWPTRVMRALACSNVSSLVTGPNQIDGVGSGQRQPVAHALGVGVDDLVFVGALERGEDLRALPLRRVAGDRGEVDLLLRSAARRCRAVADLNGENTRILRVGWHRSGRAAPSAAPCCRAG